MGALADALALARATAGEWQALSWQGLTFGRRDWAILILSVFTALTAVGFIVRAFVGRKPGKTHIALPALPPILRRSRVAFVRHTPFAFFLAGLAFFFVALADPYTAFTQDETSYPGRRIAVVIDASMSMLSPFTGTRFRAKGSQVDTSFSTNIGAAEYFMRMRMKGRYRDLIALIEFGNEAYVITPFTTDYDNILLSLKMIGDWNEWQRFPDQGTIIMRAIEQSVGLFDAYDFLEASGNLMVIFSDGQDENVRFKGMTLEQVLAGAIVHKVPVYLIRTSYDRQLGDVVPDKLWKEAVERTGGKFYAGADERTILRAINEIDAAAKGRVKYAYEVKRPRYMKFALTAVALWTLALALQMTLRTFRTFP